jgi:hypothetical protein
VSEDSGPDYLVTRHAPVHGVDGLYWVAVARRSHPDGSVQWTLEYWDDRGETDPDTEVVDEADAVRRAAAEFRIAAEDWRPGPQPWGKPEP